MNDWLGNFAGCMLAVGVAVRMVPDGKYEQYIRLFAGLLMILIVLEPLFRIGSMDLEMEKKVERFLAEQEKIGEKFLEERQEIEEVVIDGVRVEVTVDD